MANPTVAKWAPLAQQASSKYGIPANVLLGLIQIESGGREGLTSSAGASGLTQFVPGTAKSYGVNTAPGHAASQIDGAAKYLKALGFGSDPTKALASYNAGPGNYRAGLGYASNVLAAAKQYGTIKTPSVSPLSSPKIPKAGAATVPANTAARGQAIRDFLFSKQDPLTFAANLKAAGPATVSVAAPAAPKATTTMPSVKVSGSAKLGDPVVGGTGIGGLHPTAGLAGYPAHDYFAPSGSEAVAPISGTVIRLSGHDPAQGPVEGPHGPLGWSVYIKGSDGRTYFLTHLGSRTVTVGERLKAGQKIGTVADYAKYGTPSHVHMGVNG